MDVNPYSDIPLIGYYRCSARLFEPGEPDYVATKFQWAMNYIDEFIAFTKRFAGWRAG